MANTEFSEQIWRLFQSGAWLKARKLLEAERKKEPENHWLLTQLGVTFYEQRQYAEAHRLFLASQKIVPDCPLTLWNCTYSIDDVTGRIRALHGANGKQSNGSQIKKAVHLALAATAAKARKQRPSRTAVPR
jgi:predicted Zn-dependent protease